MAVCLAGTWRRFPRRPRTKRERGTTMGRRVVWNCDWCEIETEDENHVEVAWFDTGEFLLCAECEIARLRAIKEAVDTTRQSRLAERKAGSV